MKPSESLLFSLKTSFRQCWILAFLSLQLGLACAQLPLGQNLYFQDLDQDGYGNNAQSQLFPSNVPPNRYWAAWGNDPDDNDNKAFPIPIPKGARLLGVELSAWDSNLDNQLTKGNELGAGVYVAQLRWSALEVSPSAYSPVVIQSLQKLSQRLNQAGKKLVISLDVIDGQTLSVPADIATQLESNPSYLATSAAMLRYERALTQLKASLGTTSLVALRMGKHVDAYKPPKNASNFWTAYAAFMKQSRVSVKTLWGDSVAVGVSASLLGQLQEPTRSVMGQLNAESDWVFAGFLPAEIGLLNPLKTREMIQYLLAAANGKPLAVMPIGFPSATDVGSSENYQSQFLRSLFDVWDNYAAYMPLVSLTPLQDDSAYSDAKASGTYGLYDAASKQKVAYDVLRSLTFERDWPLPEATSRKFRLGFTLSPYDAPKDTLSQLVVSAYVDKKVKQYGDLIHLHMDGGIPWQEAFADPFNTAEPPYPSAVMTSWNYSLNRLDRSKKILVSINPLGIPRNILAPAWGSGENFVFDDQYNRIGTGQFQEGELRLPTAPFDKASINSYEVKVAYLKYALRTLQFFKPDYLCFAIEVNEADVADPVAFNQYIELHKFIFSELKKTADGQKTKLLVSFSATSFMTDEFGRFAGDEENGSAYKYAEMAPAVRSRLQQGLRELHPYLDVMGLSIYPHMGKYKAYTQPAGMYASMMDFMKAAGVPDDKPLAVTESGYPADAFYIYSDLITGTTDKQRRHLELMLYELQKSSHPVEFVVNFLVRDSDKQWNQMQAAGTDPQLMEFYKNFRDIGLFNGAGNARPALGTWSKFLQLPYQP